MAKRFTDTNKWDHAWFRKLKPAMKAAWIYILDKCDHAGVWTADFEALSFHVGEEITQCGLEQALDGKIDLISDDKYLISSFVDFQYGQLRDNNTVHVSVANRLKKLGMEPEVESGYSTRPSAVMARLSEKKKLSIMAEDFYKCTYCGLSGDTKTLVIDHIVPRNVGGENSENNLTTACVSCNAKKTDLNVNVFIDRHNLISKLSERLIHKLEHLREQTTAFKDLSSPKDKDKDKDKEKDKELSAALDFEALYKKYPRKEGKPQGLIQCMKQIKTQEQYDQLSRAIDRYASHCAKTEQIVKHFSSFLGSPKTGHPWREWLEAETGMMAKPEKEKIDYEKLYAEVGR